MCKRCRNRSTKLHIRTIHFNENLYCLKNVFFFIFNRFFFISSTPTDLKLNKVTRTFNKMKKPYSKYFAQSSEQICYSKCKAFFLLYQPQPPIIETAKKPFVMHEETELTLNCNAFPNIHISTEIYAQLKFIEIKCK